MSQNHGERDGSSLLGFHTRYRCPYCEWCVDDWGPPHTLAQEYGPLVARQVWIKRLDEILAEHLMEHLMTSITTLLS